MKNEYIILLVEDNLIHASIIINSLNNINKKKIKIIHLSTGEDAYQYIDSHYNINLFIFDIKLPDFSGDVLLRHIRTEPYYAHSKVFILTSSNSFSDRKRCDDFDVDEYFIKDSNFTVKSLESLVEKIKTDYVRWRKKR